jgi:hypothetical protein
MTRIPPRGDAVTDFPLNERKLVYRVLHGSLTRHPELMDLAFLDHLQADLQQHAAAAGVDVSDHGAWDAWLGNEPVACAVRVAKRQVIGG